MYALCMLRGMYFHVRISFPTSLAKSGIVSLYVDGTKVNYRFRIERSTANLTFGGFPEREAGQHEYTYHPFQFERVPVDIPVEATEIKQAPQDDIKPSKEIEKKLQRVGSIGATVYKIDHIAPRTKPAVGLSLPRASPSIPADVKKQQVRMTPIDMIAYYTVVFDLI